MLGLNQRQKRRRPSLTPMIDVVFLLLVFFMLASRFGTDKIVEITHAGSGNGTYLGAPRLIDIGADGLLSLNGFATSLDALPDRLGPLMPTADALVIARTRPDATIQDLITVLEYLRANNITNIAVAGTQP